MIWKSYLLIFLESYPVASSVLAGLHQNYGSPAGTPKWSDGPGKIEVLSITQRDVFHDQSESLCSLKKQARANLMVQHLSPPHHLHNKKKSNTLSASLCHTCNTSHPPSAVSRCFPLSPRFAAVRRSGRGRTEVSSRLFDRLVVVLELGIQLLNGLEKRGVGRTGVQE